MTAKYFLSCLLLGLCATGCATAKTKKKARTGVAIIEAYHQATGSGNAGNPPMTGDHFVVSWNEASYPETFFWRGQGGWLSCKIEKAHKAGKSASYTTEETGGNGVHKGDTLVLSPVTGGRFAIPKEIPETAKNTLFYKTGGSAWKQLAVKTIKKK